MDAAPRCKSESIRYSRFDGRAIGKDEFALKRFQAVCRTEEVPEGRALAVEADGCRIGLFKANGRIQALAGRCPHAGGPLDRGWVENDEAVCPLHRWRFRLSDGRCSNVSGERVRTFRLKIEDEVVFVEVG